MGNYTVAAGQYCLVSLVRKHTNPYKMTMQHNVEMTCGAVRHSKARKTSAKFVDGTLGAIYNGTLIYLHIMCAPTACCG